MPDMHRTPVLVTGADGFIGSHLTERLVAEGADVRALCLYNSMGSAGWLDHHMADRPGNLEIVFGDVRDAERMADVIADRALVFHLAALIAIPYSYESPRSFVETNVTGTLNVLEACRRSGARMINTSTSEVYGTPETVPITESHPLQGQSPYSATKIAADKLCESYARSFDLPVTTLRPFNTYGPRQSARAVIPTILGQLIAGLTTIELGSLEPQRDFTFVSDTVDGFVAMAASDLEPGTTVHLGTGQTVSIGELAETCAAAVGVSADIVVDPERVRPEASEVDILLSDPSHAAATIDWKPSTSLADGLGATAAWLRENPVVADPTAYTR